MALLSTPSSAPEESADPFPALSAASHTQNYVMALRHQISSQSPGPAQPRSAKNTPTTFPQIATTARSTYPTPEFRRCPMCGEALVCIVAAIGFSVLVVFSFASIIVNSSANNSVRGKEKVMKKNQWSFFKIKHVIWCLFGKHVWQRPMLLRLNSLPGEEDFKCHFCGKHKTFFNRTETILVMPNAIRIHPAQYNRSSIPTVPRRAGIL